MNLFEKRRLELAKREGKFFTPKDTPKGGPMTPLEVADRFYLLSTNNGIFDIPAFRDAVNAITSEEALHKIRVTTYESAETENTLAETAEQTMPSTTEFFNSTVEEPIEEISEEKASLWSWATYPNNLSEGDSSESKPSIWSWDTYPNNMPEGSVTEEAATPPERAFPQRGMPISDNRGFSSPQNSAISSNFGQRVPPPPGGAGIGNGAPTSGLQGRDVFGSSRGGTANPGLVSERVARALHRGGTAVSSASPVRRAENNYKKEIKDAKASLDSAINVVDFFYTKVSARKASRPKS